MSFFKGSEWNKWDLHVHTPFTKLNDSFEGGGIEDEWKMYCERIENSDVKVFGITDYFSVDNYYIFKKKHLEFYPHSQKIFFPNIEFRLDVSVNKKAEEINIHVLFSDLVIENKIRTFLTKLNTLLRVNGAAISCSSLESTQFISATVSFIEIKNVLNDVFGNEKPYIIIAASNNGGLRADTNSPRKLSISDEIDKICDAFFGGKQNQNYFLKQDRYENNEVALRKPVISGCDAHSFFDMDDALGKKYSKTILGIDQIICDITWIKAEKSFEGLKQVLHEPEYRIHIGEDAPRIPMRHLDKINFSFPDNITIKKTTSQTFQELCIKNLKHDIYLSPYLTCLIGGRGTGKSTIINLIAEKLGSKTDFFSPEQNSLFIEGQKYNLLEDKNNYISISNSTDVEFVSQGKIEKLTEGKELANLIFEERILQPNSDLQKLRKHISEKLELIDEQIQLIFALEKISNVINSSKRQKQVYQGIVDSINDPIYISITELIKELSYEINSLSASRDNYTNLVEKVKLILQETSINDLSDNFYDLQIKKVHNYLLGLDEIKAEENSFTVKILSDDSTNDKLLELMKNLTNAQEVLRKFFVEKGTSIESINDSQTASTNLSLIDTQIARLATDQLNVSNKIFENEKSLVLLADNVQHIKSVIEIAINNLNKVLISENENLSAISYAYSYNINSFKKALLESFTSIFKEYHISGTSWDQVGDVLFSINPSELISTEYPVFMTMLDEKILDGYKQTTNYVKIINSIFASEINFIIYVNLIKKHFYNVFTHVDIQGFYGKRELESCSFGQKCTAVIVTLLMSGVKPLIIDEPEAHLDNKLIADYLVDLIKTKKSDRQLIFATHNANFVINGDSDLIYVLEIPEDTNLTLITPTTIENIKYRDKLLKLEGGKEAFEKRERKLLSKF